MLLAVLLHEIQQGELLPLFSVSSGRIPAEDLRYTGVKWSRIEGMNAVETLRAQRDAILRIAAKHGATNVRVFGSFARGEAGPYSDIDLLVDFEPGRSLLDHAGLVIELEALLDRKVEVGTPNGLKERYRGRILEEAVAL